MEELSILVRIPWHTHVECKSPCSSYVPQLEKGFIRVLNIGNIKNIIKASNPIATKMM
ncbi:hypothetical protein KAI92_03740 [Candidatus Parcubacteria bacterium]|nr:hypothetical protein [Candidatus Parcubacteria bacterium]